MKIKFNKFERVAGLFVGLALLSSVFIMIIVAVKQGWFSSRTEFRTVFDRANGVFPGTRVEMAGIKVGSVDEVEFQENDRIVVHFSVLEKYAKRVHEDSYISTSRLFIIGDKVIDISLGTPSSKIAQAGALIPLKSNFDILELLDARNLGSWMTTISAVTENLKFLAEAFTNKDRAKGLVSMFDQIDPLLKNANQTLISVNEMSLQMTYNKNLKTTLANLAVTTNEINKVVQAMPNMSQDMVEAIKTVNVLVSTLNQMLPAIQEMAPQMPQVAKRAVEALDEAVVVLKSLQKSFLLSGNAKEVRKEEAERRKQNDDARKPASESSEGGD